MKARLGFTLAAALAAAALPARGGEVKVSFAGGRATVIAVNASPREILSEWARLGQVRVTNLERLSGQPVTLQMVDVPEARALDTVLRGTAGYIAAPRRDAAAAVSSFDRIILLPGVAPPASALPRPADGGPMRGRAAAGTGMPNDEAAAPPGGFTQTWGSRDAGAGPNRRPMSGQYQPAILAGDEPGADDRPEGTPSLPVSSAVPGLIVGAPGAGSSPTGAARPGEMTTPVTATPAGPYGTAGQGQPLVVNPLALQYGAQAPARPPAQQSSPTPGVPIKRPW
jgi:hypothetical protein